MDKNQKTAQESPILGKQSVSLKKPVYIIESASVVGKKEGEGPLGELFDLVGEDDMFGGQTWEDAESTLQKEALGTALGKAGWKAEEVRYLFAGDLLGQEIATSFGLVSFEIPPVRPVWSLLHLRAFPDPGLSRDKRRFCGESGLCDKQPFCQCGEGIPLSSGLRQPAPAFRHLDRDRKRRFCACRFQKRKSQGQNHRTDFR